MDVDLGAHPNERAVTANLKMVEEGDRLTVQAFLLHGDDIYLEGGAHDSREMPLEFSGNVASDLQR